MEQVFKDFNVGMQSKDNFISQNMEILEKLVDKTKIIKSDSLLEFMFGDLEADIRNEN